jgi:hypothetical protein
VNDLLRRLFSICRPRESWKPIAPPHTASILGNLGGLKQLASSDKLAERVKGGRKNWFHRKKRYKRPLGVSREMTSGASRSHFV